MARRANAPDAADFDAGVASAPAHRINPEAGTHKVTAEPDELEACRRASQRSYAAFRYYEQRYGDRGRQFGVSDGGWIVTLCRLPQHEAWENIAWLSRLLSARGMPSIMLERHLRFLHEELLALAPGRKDAYKSVRAWATTLARKRLARISLADSAALIAEFGESETAELVLSAVVDEANGISGALNAYVDWLKESDQASGADSAAVDRLVARARAAVRA